MTASQADLWSGPVGESWVRNATAYDRILEPLGLAALARLPLRPGDRVLDIGCGTGTTTFDLGRRVGPAGSVVGVDVSRPMIECARARRRAQGDHVDFALLDAERDALPGPFDAAFSRLGVMFFDRPQAAFSNIAASMRPGGRLAFVCFASPAENPFITVSIGAVLALLDVPQPPPAAGGNPFALADPDAVRRLLESAGFDSVAVSRGPAEVTLGSADDLAGVASRALEQNPLLTSLLTARPQSRAALADAIAGALREHVHDADVRLGAGTWIVEATRLPSDEPQASPPRAT